MKETRGVNVMKKYLIYVAVGVLLVSTGCGSTSKNKDAKAVWKFHSSPIIYQDDLYCYSDNFSFDKENAAKETIKLGSKDLFYDQNDTDQTVLIESNDEVNRTYVKASELESEEYVQNVFNTYDDYILVKNNALGKVYDERQVIDKEAVMKLEEKYGAITYRLEELKRAEEVYFVQAGCKTYEEFLDKYCDGKAFQVGDYYDTEMPEIYVGILFRIDNTWYYGNTDNRVDDEILQLLPVSK